MSPTSVNATKALRPRPAARAKGYLAYSPMASVMTPATSAVTVRTWGKRSWAPVSSLTKPRM
jgi:hypothetical protein